MTDSQLELKYDISNSSLRMVYRKLVAAGVLKEDELPTAERDTKADSPESFQTGDVYCPSCKSVQAPGARNVPSVAWYLKNWQHFNPIKTRSQ